MKSTIIIDIDGFALTFPVHVIVGPHHEVPGALSLWTTLVVKSNGEAVDAICVFSDEENVFRYLGENRIPRDGLQGRRFNLPQEFAASLRISPPVAMHLAFDLGLPGRPIHNCSIARFLEIVSALPQDLN